MKLTHFLNFSKQLDAMGAEFLPHTYLLLSKEGRDNCTPRKLIYKKLQSLFGSEIVFLSFDSTVTAVRFEEEAGSLNFFVRKKAITLYEADKISKEVWSSLLHIDWGEDLFFILEGVSCANSHYKELEKKGLVLDLSLEKSWEREKNLQALAGEILAKEGKAIDPKALLFLTGKGEVDYQEFLIEMEKMLIATLHKNRIELQDVLEMIPYRRSLSPYLFSDAVLDKNRRLAHLECLLRLDAKDPLLVILKQLRTQFQNLLKISSILRSGLGKEAITEHFPYMRGAILDRQVSLASLWRYDELLIALLQFDDIEMMAKNGVTDEKLLADLLLSKIIP